MRKPLPRPRTIAGEQLRRYAMEGLVNQLEQGLTPLEAMSLLGARAAGRSPKAIQKRSFVPLQKS